VLFLNALTIGIAGIALLLTAVYPFMKRHTHWPQLVLGLAFSCAIPMGFAAQTNSVPLIAWILFSASTLWTIMYDTQYAMVDRKDDLKAGIKSTAILFGKCDRIIIAALQLLVIALLIVAGVMEKLHWIYYLGLFTASGFFCSQQRLIYTRDPSACFRAFLNNQWVGLIIWLGLIVSIH
jgi:4-hydroxybenzoate polyprenyltransferase